MTPALASPAATLATATIPTPPGPFTFVADAGGTVLASGWAADPAELAATIGPARVPALAAALRDGALADGSTSPIAAAVEAYVAGDLTAIDAIPAPAGPTPFLDRAWRELRAIPAGAPLSYAQLADRCGSPAAVRAAGSACGRNLAALFVPCHRALRSDGSLGGFLYGLDVKRWLLAHEAGAATG